MAIRVTEAEVRAIIDTDSSISIAPFIDVATVIVDKLVAQDSNGSLTTSALEEIEKQLAAHFYDEKDAQYSSKTTGQSSATFQGTFGRGLERTKWGQTAKFLDWTGYLSWLDKPERPKAGLSWGGKAKSDQIDYEDRD